MASSVRVAPTTGLFLGAPEIYNGRDPNQNHTERPRPIDFKKEYVDPDCLRPRGIFAKILTMIAGCHAISIVYVDRFMKETRVISIAVHYISMEFLVVKPN